MLQFAARLRPNFLNSKFRPKSTGLATFCWRKLLLLPNFSLLFVPSLWAHAYASSDYWGNPAQDFQHDFPSPKPLPGSFQQKLAKMTDLKRIEAYLEKILVVRPVNSSNHEKVGLYIKRVLENLQFDVEMHNFTQSTILGPLTFRNVIATQNSKARKRLVLACHYDSKMFNKFEFLGATDSAVPCALMLDVARTLHPFFSTIESSDLTLQLVFFDGEEAFKDWTETDSLYGSRELASKWSNQTYTFKSDRDGSDQQMTELQRINVLVLLDLLGAPNPTVPDYYTYNDQATYALLQKIEKDLKSAGLLHPMPEFFTGATPYFVDDDHKPFIKLGVRTVHVIPSPFPDVWHRRTDNWDAVHWPTVRNWATILRVFTATYLGVTDSNNSIPEEL